MVTANQKRSKSRRSRARKLADLAASRQAKNIKGGSPSLTGSAPPASRSGEGCLVFYLGGIPAERQT
jgi:hypothetical protein